MKRDEQEAPKQEGQEGRSGEIRTGVLEMTRKGRGVLRPRTTGFKRSPQDPAVSHGAISRFNLRPGNWIEGIVDRGRGGQWQVKKILKVNGLDPEEWAEVEEYSERDALTPDEQYVLETGPEDYSMRVIDLIAPIGKGTRGLIVATPRSGKTVLLQQMARSIGKNYPDSRIIALLVDERPEEVTDFKRKLADVAEVYASPNDGDISDHTRVSQLAMAYAHRWLEVGEDVVVLLDSLTRLGRAFNVGTKGSGRTMSGGMDARGMEIPRKIFGSARKLEPKGSLTIMATCLIETGSRMDDVIFHEFRGTGNMELVLDRRLSDLRIFPAINIAASGTRNEERFFSEEVLKAHHAIRRHLTRMQPVEAMEALLKALREHKSNKELLDRMLMVANAGS
ncbi:MAG: transcription termination factor Rho [Nitrospirae bacterium]|nr:MAG: transcription termination factor Rho [Nitrospirota bacterium]